MADPIKMIVPKEVRQEVFNELSAKGIKFEEVVPPITTRDVATIIALTDLGLNLFMVGMAIYDRLRRKQEKVTIQLKLPDGGNLEINTGMQEVQVELILKDAESRHSEETKNKA